MKYADLQNEVLNEVFKTIYNREENFWKQFKRSEVIEAINEHTKLVPIEISEKEITIDSKETFTLQDQHLFEHLIITNNLLSGGTSIVIDGYPPSQFRLNLIKNILKKVCEIRYLKGYVLTLPPSLNTESENWYMDIYHTLHEGENKIDNPLTIYNFNKSLCNMLNLYHDNTKQAACYPSLIGYYTSDFVRQVENMGLFFDNFINAIMEKYLISHHEKTYDLALPFFSRFELTERLPAFTILAYAGKLGAIILEVENKAVIFDFKLLHWNRQMLDYFNGYENVAPLHVVINKNKEQIAILKNPDLNAFNDYSLCFEEEEDSLELITSDNSNLLTRFIKSVAKVDFEKNSCYESNKAFSYLASCFEGSVIELLQILNTMNKSQFEIVYCQQQNEKRIYDKIVLKIYTKDKSSCSVLFISHNKSTNVFEYESSTSDSETSIFSFIR